MSTKSCGAIVGSLDDLIYSGASCEALHRLGVN